nr:dickkopf-related protein 4-like [Misgurnus anguillicaudatus]
MQTVMFLLSVISAVQCLESNIIQSSREMTSSQESVLHLQSEIAANSHNFVRRRSFANLGITDCNIAQANKTCKSSKKKQRYASKTRIQVNGRRKQRVPENSPCVRSRDCEEGLCCALYLTGRRCQRVPVMGEVCLLRGRAKFRRRLDRCDCETNLYCRAQADSPRGQGVCNP